jgi:hypothetical protein
MNFRINEDSVHCYIFIQAAFILRMLLLEDDIRFFHVSIIVQYSYRQCEFIVSSRIATGRPPKGGSSGF